MIFCLTSNIFVYLEYNLVCLFGLIDLAKIEQLNKDLMLSGLEYEFDINSEKDTFIDAMLIFLETTMNENEYVLFNFLYRVDVDQKYIYSKDLLPQENLLRLILNRELQKVVLKRLYSSGTSS